MRQIRAKSILNEVMCSVKVLMYVYVPLAVGTCAFLTRVIKGGGRVVRLHYDNDDCIKS